MKTPVKWPNIDVVLIHAATPCNSTNITHTYSCMRESDDVLICSFLCLKALRMQSPILMHPFHSVMIEPISPSFIVYFFSLGRCGIAF